MCVRCRQKIPSRGSLLGITRLCLVTPNRILRDRIFYLHLTQIENSIPRVTVGHHKTLPSDAPCDAKQDPGTEFSICVSHTFDSFSCIPFEFHFFFLGGALYKNISTLHVYEVQTENSIPWVTVMHLKALSCDAKQDPEGQNFLSAPHTRLILFLVYLLMSNALF